MFNYTKTYNRYGDIFEFIFSTSVNVGFDFDITDMSDLEDGFLDTNDELMMYPGNIDITIDDLSEGNYNRFKTLLDQYNAQYPYNFADVLTMTIKKNGSEIYVGILSTCEYEFEPPEISGEIKEFIKLRWLSGVSKLKELEFGNYYVLDKLYQVGLISRINVYKAGEHIGYMYGYDFAVIMPNSTLLFSEPIATRVNIYDLLYEIFKFINPQCFLSINHNWLYNDTHIFQELICYGIEPNITGRFFVKKESVYVVFAHDPGRWVRQQHSMVNGEEWSVWWDSDDNEGVPDRKLNEAVKFIARNFGAIAGMTSFNSAFFRKRFYINPAEAVDITDNAKNIRKETFLRKVSEVKINDLFPNPVYTAKRGETSQGKNLLEYSITLSAYDAGNSSGANLLIYVGNNQQYVLRVTDPNLPISDKLSEVLAELEWQTRKVSRDKFTFEIDTTDVNFTQYFKITHKGETKYIRPIKMQRYLLENKTQIEGVETN